MLQIYFVTYITYQLKTFFHYILNSRITSLSMDTCYNIETLSMWIYIVRRAFLKSGTLNTTLLVHIDIWLTQEKPYQCEYCQMWSAHKSSLANHIRIHRKRNPINCEYWNIARRALERVLESYWIRLFLYGPKICINV